MSQNRKENRGVEPVKGHRRGSCWWQVKGAVQMRAKREGLLGLGASESATQRPNLERVNYKRALYPTPAILRHLEIY